MEPTFRILNYEIRMPAGKYYLGDPCYCFDEQWANILEETEYFEKPYTKNGKTIMAFPTAYGDGMYYDQHRNEYGVDAGLIGLVPVEMAEKNPGSASKLVEFPASFICKNENGNMKFGRYLINTTGQEEQEGEY